MPPISPSDEPALPKLRRFRFDPADPQVAREVFHDGAVAASHPPAPTERPAGPADDPAHEPDDLDAPADDPDDHDDPLHHLREADRLIAALDRTVPASRTSTGPTRPASAPMPRTSTRGATPRPAETAGSPLDSRRGAEPAPHTVAARHAELASSATASSAAASSAAASDPTARAGRSRRAAWPYLVAGFAAALVIGLVAWLLLAPAPQAGDRGAPVVEGAAEPAVDSWATGVCTLISEYRTAALPLRAAAAQLSATAADGAAATDLRREAGQLLSTLADDLQAVGRPESSASVSAAHTTIIGALNVAAAAVTSGAGSPTGAPADAATILTTLDRPTTVFQEAVSAMPAAEREAVSEQQACTTLL